MRTIFALATARGKSGVAVLRISGPDAFAIGTSLCGSLPGVGCFSLRRITDALGELIDQALVLSFQAPASFTGEDVVELQVHGSMAVVRRIEDAISGTGLASPAPAGEFTRRALMNDRLDLAQVEGLGDLIDAETEAQRRLAVQLFDGGLRAKSAEWREGLISAAALIESTIDFADEEVPDEIDPSVAAKLRMLRDGIAGEIEGSRINERIRDGFEVAILGVPNAGKSTLLNAIAKREVAITSEIAGTTRDVLEVRVDLDGLPVTFLDTAGLRETTDSVEQIGVARAKERAEKADLRIVLQPPGDEIPPDLVWRDGDIWVASKADMTNGDGISALTGVGVSDLLNRVGAILAERAATQATASHARHRAALSQALEALEAALNALSQDEAQPELIAEDLRRCIHALDSLVGRVDVEAILGKIFSRFCIGK